MASGLLLVTPQAWIASLGGDIWLLGMLSVLSLPFAVKPLLAILLDSLRNRLAWTYIHILRSMILFFGVLLFWLGGVDPLSQTLYFSSLLCLGCFIASMIDICIDGARIQHDGAGEQEMVAGYYTTGYRIGLISVSGLGLVLAKYYGWVVLYQGAGVAMATSWVLIKATQVSGETNVDKQDKNNNWDYSAVKNWLIQKSIQLVVIVVLLIKLHDIFVESMLQSYLINHLHLGVDTVGLIYKSFGIAASIAGGLLGAWFLIRLGVYYMLAIAIVAKAAAMVVFILSMYSMQESVLLITTLAITLESFASGWTTTLIVVLMSRVCEKAYAATQFAFLTSLIFVLKVVVGPLAAGVVYMYSWDGFFLGAMLALIPPCGLLTIKNVRAAFSVSGVLEAN
ncbi:MAG: hypothetical protein VX112_01370 [Pseudomonadota bacterium]|nr:hypothetical protein [Pseudomonadota bacterium]